MMAKELPKGWVETTLGEIAKWSSGGTPSRSNSSYYGGNIPWIKTGDLNDSFIHEASEFITEEGLKHSSAKLFPKGSVVIAMYGATIGKTGIFELEAATNQACGVGIPTKCSSKFLFYFLKSQKQNFIELGKGGAQPNISQGVIKDFKINLPPLPEQERIVAKLDTIFAHLEVAKQGLEKIPMLLKQFRQAVLTQAVTGKLTEEWSRINEFTEVTDTIEKIQTLKIPSRYNSRNTSIIPGRYALSVGKPNIEIPRRYRWTELVKVASLETGHTPSRNHPEYWGGEIDWIGIKDAREHHGQIIYKTQQKTNELGLANSAARLLPKGTVCLSRTASVGYVLIMGKDMATSQDFVNWVCSEAINPNWLKILLLAEKDSILEFGKGTTHTTVYFPEVISFHIALPPIEEQTEIVRRVEALFSKADAIEARYKKLKEQIDQLPQAVLAKAFRGEV